MRAATYHVHGATGSDASQGRAAEPFKTISRAARVAEPGDTVVVAPGTYDERVNVSGFRDATQRTIFRAEPAGEAVLDGKQQQFRFSVRRPKVSIIGFECRNSREHAVDFNEPADDGLVDRCVLVDNELDGVFFRKCKGGRVRNTIAARNGRHGIWFLQSTGGAAVSNTLYRNRSAGLSVDETPDVVAFNNIIAENGVGVRVGGPAGQPDPYASWHWKSHDGFCRGQQDVVARRQDIRRPTWHARCFSHRVASGKHTRRSELDYPAGDGGDVRRSLAPPPFDRLTTAAS